MADDTDEFEAEREILNQYLHAAGKAPSIEIESAADSAIKQLLEFGSDDVEYIGPAILDFVQGQNSDENIQRLPPVVTSLRRQVSPDSFNTFGWSVREAWNYNESEDDDGATLDVKRERWRRVNAFIAMFTAQENGPYLLNGLWTLRSAFEHDSPDTIAANLSAASMWMIYAAEPIYNSAEEYRPVTALAGDPARPGQKFAGRRGFSRERWQFWKQGFEDAQNNDQLDENQRLWAEKAVSAMSSVESVN